MKIEAWDPKDGAKTDQAILPYIWLSCIPHVNWQVVQDCGLKCQLVSTSDDTAFKPWLSITLDQDILLIAHSAFFLSFSPPVSLASLSCSAPGFSPEHQHLTQPEPSRAGELMPPRATQLQDGESVTEKSKPSVMWWENSEVHATQFTRGSQ